MVQHFEKLLSICFVVKRYEKSIMCIKKLAWLGYLKQKQKKQKPTYQPLLICLFHLYKTKMVIVSGQDIVQHVTLPKDD